MERGKEEKRREEKRRERREKSAYKVFYFCKMKTARLSRVITTTSEEKELFL
jgi:hypothetical protein